MFSLCPGKSQRPTATAEECAQGPGELNDASSQHQLNPKAEWAALHSQSGVRSLGRDKEGSKGPGGQEALKDT